MKTTLILGLAVIAQPFLVSQPLIEVSREPSHIEIREFPKVEPLSELELPVRRTEKPQKVVPAQSGQSHSTEAVKATIVKYARMYGVSETSLLRIAKCESNYNPRAVNYNYSVKGTHPSGLFQHVALYWPDRATRYGRSGASVFDYDAQADVTAQMFRDGGSGLWECK